MAEHYDILPSYPEEEYPSHQPKEPIERELIPSSYLRPRNIYLYIFVAFILFLSGALVSTFILITYLNGYTHFKTEQKWSYETGFQEERLLPQSLVQLEQRRFKYPVDFRLDDGEEYLVMEPDDKVYTGTPSPEIDHAWHELLWGRYFSISEEEAKRLWPDNYEDFRDREKSGFTGGFDMFHQLHCLNQIRQALHRDYYPEFPIHGVVHLEHCINHIRQAIMCWGSTAVTPNKWFEGYHHEYVKSDVVHTCRKFEPIRNYVQERFNGSLFVPRPKKGVHEFDSVF
ncbi:hypothetical protein F5884DRAFT_9763 [Xylogone sp. PMI_703]|nr:hypothetical protein F5884DRAFT_9763 [Xylogone sp. PMI_703]